MRRPKNFAEYKPFLLPIFLIGGILFTALVFLRPRITEIFEIRKNIAKERKTLADLTQKAATLEGLDEVELSQKTKILLKALPPEKDVAALLLTFKVLSSQQEVNLRGVKIDPGETLSLKIEGSPEKITGFMEKIETVLPLMKLEETSISFKEEGLLEATVKVKVSFLPLPKELGAMESPLPLITSQEEKIYQEVANFNSVLTEESLPPVQSGKENPFAF